MLINTVKDIEEFNAIVDSCKGDVYLQSVDGDKYNLKSQLSRYVAIADMLRDQAGKLELFASLPEDESKFFDFFSRKE